MNNRLGVVVLVLVVLFAAERPAEAYLDPGSGSMLLQLMLGGFAAAAVAGRLMWHRLRARLGAPVPRPETRSVNEPKSPSA